MRPATKIMTARLRTGPRALPAGLAAAAVIAAASAVGGCGTSEPATGTESADVHLDAIGEVVPDHDPEDKRVTVAGEVKGIISPLLSSLIPITP